MHVFCMEYHCLIIFMSLKCHYHWVFACQDPGWENLETNSQGNCRSGNSILNFKSSLNSSYSMLLNIVCFNFRENEKCWFGFRHTYVRTYRYVIGINLVDCYARRQRKRHDTGTVPYCAGTVPVIVWTWWWGTVGYGTVPVRTVLICSDI